MCFWDSPSIDTPTPSPASPPPPPAPAPTPTAPLPAEETASRIAERKRKQAAALKYGMSSTVKTSGIGDVTGVNLLMPALMTTGLKTKLGQ